jgi:hypothetical protein
VYHDNEEKVQYVFIHCLKFFSSETKLHALLTSVRMDYISVRLTQCKNKECGTDIKIRAVAKGGNQKLNFINWFILRKVVSDRMWL